MSTTRTARPAMASSVPKGEVPAGHTNTLSGHALRDTQPPVAAEGQDSPQATDDSTSNLAAPAGNRTVRPATDRAAPIAEAPTGLNDTLSGHTRYGTHTRTAAEGQDSPQAIQVAVPTHLPPAGTQTAQPATEGATPTNHSLAGHQNGRDQSGSVTQSTSVPATNLPGVQKSDDTHPGLGTGDQHPPAANGRTAPKDGPPLADRDQPVATAVPTTNQQAPLADPLLALAADVLGDLEKVRIANENRLRQLTRSTEDSDGETRGFGLDETHPDVARLAALVAMLAKAEHQATLNLARLMRKHPLSEWVKRQKGVGEKQGARLLAAVGDPYIRPEIIREGGTVEPSRPRKVSELWAFAGYHVIKVPVSGQKAFDAHSLRAADGPSTPADQRPLGTHGIAVGGEQNGGDPGQATTPMSTAGVAPRRARGSKANWSGAAKMRAYLVAESCIKQLDGHYRTVYDGTREKYADAIHVIECIRCGPKGRPAQPGSPLSAGHQHARALRAVAKEVLKDLWREAKRLHEQAPVSGQRRLDPHSTRAADGLDVPAGQSPLGTHTSIADGDQAHHGPDGGAR